MSSFESSVDDGRTIGLLGIAGIDAQHQQLHRIIRELAVFPNEPITCLWSQQLLGEIWRRSFDHFREEERLMAESGVPSEEIGSHAADHMRCLNYVTKLWTPYPLRCAAPNSGEVCYELTEYWRKHIALYDGVVTWRAADRSSA